MLQEIEPGWSPNEHAAKIKEKVFEIWDAVQRARAADEAAPIQQPTS